MIPWESKGGRSSNYRGRGGRGRASPIIQHGNKRLINENISNINQLEDNPELFQKVQEYLNKKKNKNEGESSSISYAEVVTSKEEEKYLPNPYKDFIMIIDFADLKWQKEPWKIMQKYMDTASYPVPSGKKRSYYEELLINMGVCELRHFKTHKDAKVINFSKIIIKQVISAEDWGLATLRERECQIRTDSNSREIIKFNFWDLKEAYYKTFFYQNPYHKHTWWIKICPKVYSQGLPNWLYDWWQIFGTSEKILPEEFRIPFNKWKIVSPALIEAENQNRYIHNMEYLHFFAEFGIPWIWRWEPEVGTNNNNVPRVNRCFSTRFWTAMMEKDKNGEIQGIQTLHMIKEKVEFYSEQMRVNKTQAIHKSEISPFEQYLRDNISKMSEKELIANYMASIKGDIARNLGKDICQLEDEDEDVDITSTSSKKKDSTFQDAQDPFEDDDMDPDDTFANFIESIEKKSSKESSSSSQKNRMME